MAMTSLTELYTPNSFDQSELCWKNRRQKLGKL